MRNGVFTLGHNPIFYHVQDIYQNLSIINPEEQNLMDRNRFWYKDTKIQVFSRSNSEWCVGRIEKVFYLKSSDPLDAHDTKWYSVSYLSSGKRKYKQLVWHSEDIRAAVQVDCISCSIEFEEETTDEPENDSGSQSNSYSRKYSRCNSYSRNSIIE